MEKFFEKVMEIAPAYLALTLAAQKLGYVGVGVNTPEWFKPVIAAPKPTATP